MNRKFCKNGKTEAVRMKLDHSIDTQFIVDKHLFSSSLGGILPQLAFKNSSYHIQPLPLCSTKFETITNIISTEMENQNANSNSLF